MIHQYIHPTWLRTCSAFWHFATR